MKPFICLAAMTACALLSSGCHKNVSVSCQPQAPSIDNLAVIASQNMGYINSNGSSLGQVYDLSYDGNSGRVFANPNGTVAYANDGSDPDYKQNPPANSTIKVAVSWTVNGTGTLSPQQVITVEANADKTWDFTLTNTKQVFLSNTLTEINTEARNLALKSQILANPTHIYLIFNPVQNGDSGSLDVSQNAGVNVSIPIHFLLTAKVNYSCSSTDARSKVQNSPDQPALLLYPEFVRAAPNGKEVEHAPGLKFPSHGKSETVMVSSGTSESSAGPKPRAPYKLVLCKKSGNDLGKYPGCLK